MRGLGARRWAPLFLLGALGDGLLADGWRENGNHHGVLAHPAVSLLFFPFLLSQTLASKITSIGNPPSTSSMVHAVGVLCCCVCPACLLVPLLLNACSCCALIHGGEGTAGGCGLNVRYVVFAGGIPGSPFVNCSGGCVQVSASVCVCSPALTRGPGSR